MLQTGKKVATMVLDKENLDKEKMCGVGMRYASVKARSYYFKISHPIVSGGSQRMYFLR